MAYYLVRGRFMPGRAEEFHKRLHQGDFMPMRPFGPTLTRAMQAARWDETAGQLVWELECYCSPPLLDERAQVLNFYFETVETERVPRDEGWARVAHLPRMWPS